MKLKCIKKAVLLSSFLMINTSVVFAEKNEIFQDINTTIEYNELKKENIGEEDSNLKNEKSSYDETSEEMGFNQSSLENLRINKNVFEYTDLKDGEIKLTKYLSDSSEIVIPSEIDGKTVTELGNDLFSGLTINYIKFPNTLKIIGSGVFQDTVVNCDINIPEGVEKIGRFTGGLFSKAIVNGDIILPSTIKSYGGYDFKEITVNGKIKIAGYSGLEDGHGPKKINISIFNNAKYIETIEFTGDAQLIKGKFSFGNENLINVDDFIIGEGVENIAIFPLFKYFDIKNPLKLPLSLNTIDGNAFEDTKLNHPLLIPKNVENIYAFAFNGAEIPLLEIENGVKNLDEANGNLGNNIFSNSKLLDIEIPSSAENLGDNMFEGSNFENIVIYNDQINFGKNMFSLEKDLYKNINLVGFNNSTTKKLVETIKEDFPNIKFKNFVEIEQKINGEYIEEITIDPGDKLLQNTEIIINESKGYNDLYRSVDRHIDIVINEELDKIFDIESIKAVVDKKENLYVINENGNFSIEIPKNKFYGNKPIYLEVQLKVKDNAVIKEGSNLIINANISSVFGDTKEIISSNVVNLKAGNKNPTDPSEPINPEINDKGNINKKKKKEIKKEEIKKQQILNHDEYLFGYEDNTIKPEGNITREEASAILDRITPDKVTTRRKFIYPDVETNRWSYENINNLSNKGGIKGYPDGRFLPSNNITRAEAATILVRLENANLSHKENLPKELEGHWAEKDLMISINKGWLKGYEDGTLKPDREITRAEFVTLVNRILDRKVIEENILSEIREFKDLEKSKWYYEDIVEATNSHSYEEKRLKDNSEKWIDLIKSM